MTSTRARSTTTTFDPQKHLSRVSGGDYLEVKWRLVWLREKHPDAMIRTELIEHQDNMAVFSATVAIPDGGSATGWGSESAGDFRDYLEKAETKAIGRALGALGFGTQFSGFDFSLPLPNGVVDAPVSTPPPSQPAAKPAENVAVTRGDLLAKCAQEQERVGPQAILEWINTNNKPKKRADMTDQDLQEFLDWAQTQPAKTE